MNPSYQPVSGRFVVASPARWDGDGNARALAHHGLLRFSALGTRRKADGVPAELTRLNPKIGLVAYLGVRLLSSYQAESFRFRLHPWFDRWVLKQMQPGDHILSSFGFTNRTFQFVREHGGKTFYSAGNSHPENFWEIITEEHRRWNCPYPPIAPHQHERAMTMMPLTDYVLSPSSFVTRSFLARGFRPEQILRNVYPVDLDCFKPPVTPRPANRPLTVIAPGGLCLRKGTPYLLEAFRQVLKTVPNARLVLNRSVQDNVRPVFEKNSDLPIDWHPGLPHPELAELMRACDILVLPSLEDGFARTVTEGLACGLPVITTPNTGASDFIVPGQNGEIVPIRDSAAIAEAVLKWHEKILARPAGSQVAFDARRVSFEHFENDFLEQLAGTGLLRRSSPCSAIPSASQPS